MCLVAYPEISDLTMRRVEPCHLLERESEWASPVWRLAPSGADGRQADTGCGGDGSSACQEAAEHSVADHNTVGISFTLPRT